MKSRFYTAQEVAEMLGVHQSTAYKIIKRLNAELEAQGYIVINGRVPIAYFNQKCYGEDSWKYVLGKRLINNGANMDLIKYLPPSDPNFVDLNLNGELLEQFIAEHKPGLVLLDPIQSFIPENLRMGDRNAMRKCFTPLLGYGETYKTSLFDRNRRR